MKRYRSIMAVLLAVLLILSNFAGTLPQLTIYAADGEEAEALSRGEDSAQEEDSAEEDSLWEAIPEEESAEDNNEEASASDEQSSSDEEAAVQESASEQNEQETSADNTQESSAKEESEAQDNVAEDAKSDEQTTDQEGQSSNSTDENSAQKSSDNADGTEFADENSSSAADTESSESAQTGTTDVAEASSEGVIASTEAVTEAAAAESTIAEEVAAESSEEESHLIKVEYSAENGGSVTRSSETVDLANGEKPEGSEAVADDGYFFTEWTDEDGQKVSDSASFTPDLNEDTAEKVSYTAHFEKEEKEVSMPAQDFEGKVSGVHVSVHAEEGSFPEGTSMHLRSVSKNSILNNYDVQDTVGGDREVVDAVAVDITFTDKDGNEIEPLKDISVSMDTTRTLDGDNHKVLHIDDSGNVSKVASASADGASFEADAFSIYVIIGEGDSQQPAVATYTFYGADNTTVLSTQKVKSGETLTSPATPEKDGYIFKGWTYTKGSGTVDMKPIEKTTVSDVTNTSYSLYPVFEQKLYVFFMDNYGRVYQTKEGVSGDKISVSDISIPLGSEESVTGWYTDKELTNEVSEVTLTDSDVTLYPKVEAGHYLTFSTGDGATYIEPAFVAAEDVTVEPTAPARNGYTFAGWSSKEGSTSADFTFGGRLSSNTTIYAVWSADKDTKYTVIFWQQHVSDSKNASDDEKTYGYADSETRYGTTGEQASVTYSDQNKGYTGFKFNSSKSSSVTIKGDGTTVLNVYYDRNLLSINFYVYKKSWLGGRWSLKETYKGLYGQTLAQNGYTWPTEYKYGWFNEAKTNQLTFLDAFIFDSLSEYGSSTSIDVYRYSSKGSLTINHYKQGLDGTYDYDNPTNTTYNDRGTFTFTNKYTGFTVSSYYIGNSASDSSDWSSISAGNSSYYDKNLYIRYTRSSYTLSFYNYNSVSRTEKVLYESDLTAYENYVPGRPDGLPRDYTFQGWYKDPELTQKADFNQTMPVTGITLYAKWAAPTYNGTVHLTIDGTGSSIGLEIGYGETIDQSLLPTVKDAEGVVVFEGNGKDIVTLPDNVEWVGWATKGGTTYTTFNFATQIYKDIELYPYYLSKERYTVSYDTNGGSGTVKDDKSYASGSYAEIASSSGITAPDGQHFLYWSTEKDADKSGLIYYPGDKILITSDLTLYAIYGNKDQTTSLTYYSNYPSGSGMTDKTAKQAVNGSETLENNVTFNAYAIDTVGFSVPSGYYFTGWNTARNGSGTSVKAGAEILADINGSNELYAQWKKVQSLVLTVTGNTDTVTYDGAEHSVTGYSVEMTLDGSAISALPDDLKLDESAAKVKTAKGTDAGTYALGLAVSDFVISGDNLSHYSMTVNVTKDGRLTINKRNVTLTSDSASRTYNGGALTAPNVTIGGEGFVEGEVSKVYATGSQTEVGSSKNPITIDKGTGYKDSNYNITKTEGTLTVSQSNASFTIQAVSDNKEYDGTALSNSTVTVIKPDGFANYTVKATAAGTITDAGSVTNKVTSYQILDPNGNDVTEYFAEATLIDGTLTVTPRKVTLTSDSETKPYDGTALTAPDVTVGGHGFVSGEVSEIKATGSITEIGSVTNTITYTPGSAFKVDNYEITKNEGTLTVVAADIGLIITAPSGTWPYDGQTHSAGNNVTLSWKNPSLADKYTVTAEVKGSVKDVSDGKVNSTVTSYKITDASGNDVTKNLDTSKIATVDGTLEITKRDVTLTSKSDSKGFDGTPLTAPEVTEGGDKFVDGEVAELKASGSITNAGSVKNTITYTPSSKFDENNYNITKNEGTLTVTKASVAFIVTAPSKTWTYDGKDHADHEVTVTYPTEASKAYTVTASTRGSVKDVDDGPAANEVTGVKITLNGSDVTDQFDTSVITSVNGTLQITPAEITLTSESATKEYDGTPLEKPDVKVTGDIVKTNGKEEIFNIRATGSITKVGSVKNEIVYDTSLDYKANNYKVMKVEGTLTITQNKSNEITITAGSAFKTYNGTALTAKELTAKGLPSGFTVSGEAGGSITNVSDSKEGNNPVASWKILNKEGEDVSGQFAKVTTAAGTLTINPRKVTLTSADGSKSYDGTALTAPDVTVSGDGFVAGEVNKVTAAGSQTAAGESGNAPITIDKGKAYVDSNYVITEHYGTLKVTKSKEAFTITAGSDSREYNGMALLNDTSTVTSPAGFEKYTVKATTAGNITDAGSTYNKIDSYQIFDADGNDVTSSFADAELVDGTLTVTPKKVTLTSASSSQKYDGTALIASDVTIDGGFVEGEVSDVKATGSITNAGTAANTIAYTKERGFNKNNYDIEMKEGTLTVTPRTVVMTSESLSKEYDGTPLSGDKITISGDGWAEGEGATYEVTGSQTEVGQSQNVFTYKLNGNALASAKSNIVNVLDAIFPALHANAAEKVTLAENYNITQAYGTLTVTEKKQTENGGDSGNEDDTDSEDSHHHHHHGHSGSGEEMSNSSTNTSTVTTTNQSTDTTDALGAEAEPASTDNANAAQTDDTDALAETRNTGSNSAAPRTGDDSSMTMYGWIALLAAASLAAWTVKKRKSSSEM